MNSFPLRYSQVNGQQLKHLVPRTHKFRTRFPLSQMKQQRWRSSERTTSNRPKSMKTTAQSRRIPKWLTASRLGYQQVIHITSTVQTPEKYLTSEGKKRYTSIGLSSNPSQVSTS